MLSKQNRLYDTTIKARALLDTHGLSDWVFKLDRSKSHAGVCCYEQKVIQLSSVFILSDKVTDAGIEDVILHEIAHALVGPEVQPHGREWKQAARGIGCSANRCVPPFVTPKWRIRCPCGAVKGGRHTIQKKWVKTRVCAVCKRRIEIVPYETAPLKK